MFRRLRTRSEGATLGLMLALTFSTGIIDAVGYLGLDRVFAGNMTGNVVILGMALSGAADLPVVGPLIALGAFMIGAVIGGRVLRPVKKGWTSRSTWLFAVVGILLGVLAIVLAVVPEHPEPLTFTVTGVLGGAMGLQAATARHLAVKDVTTVVVTSTITGLAADSRLAGGSGQPWFRRAAAIVLIAAGAGVGALALLVGLWLGLAIAAVITLVATLLGELVVHSRYAPAPADAAA
ncbi:YoaK family protein [Rathayibacter sp. AY1B7]|uniref:YoaK family protein n=1 Tax=Rathayibacter sp. AY1B7 TaxID=2080532 RepID=UPI00280071B0|nr:YoaK family protein [Rathayibacter sp. AY1B7]